MSALQSTMTKEVYICAKLKTTYFLLKDRGENIKSPDTNELIRMNADAIASLGHISFEKSQRRRGAIKPNVNKDDATLCGSPVPETTVRAIPRKERIYRIGNSKNPAPMHSRK